MAVPKSKISPSRRGQRRAHDALKTSAYEECPDTGDMKMRHHVSPDGWYRGRQVIKPKVKTDAETSAE